jgi:hypothetical protein
VIPGWKDYLAVQQHFEDLRREAEVERLLRAGRESPERRELSISRAIAWVGQRLVSQGRRLQAQRLAASQMLDCCTGDC